jgi:AraC-like DNA-binding protein
MKAIYKEVKPSASLRNHIDAYWLLQTGSLQTPLKRSLFPDGCVDIICNIGYAAIQVICTLSSEIILLKPGTHYLAGTMTAIATVSRLPDTHLIGIRFKPGAFACFYAYELGELTNRVIDFRDGRLAMLLDGDEDVFSRIDAYYQKKKSDATIAIIPIAASIYALKGQIDMHSLAQMHNISLRTMERHFKKDIGISPKELTKIIRFQSALSRLKNKSATESIAGIASEIGYYDQAHMTNEIKKYAGLNPSQLY